MKQDELDGTWNYNDNWAWRQIVKSLKDKHKTILKMERNMQGL